MTPPTAKGRPTLRFVGLAHLIALISEPRVPGVRPWQLAMHGSGQRRGPLVAGNLTMLSMLVGTPWALPLAGALALGRRRRLILYRRCGFLDGAVGHGGGPFPEGRRKVPEERAFLHRDENRPQRS